MSARPLSSDRDRLPPKLGEVPLGEQFHTAVDPSPEGGKSHATLLFAKGVADHAISDFVIGKAFEEFPFTGRHSNSPHRAAIARQSNKGLESLIEYEDAAPVMPGEAA